jgi:hypothetical protein
MQRAAYTESELSLRLLGNGLVGFTRKDGFEYCEIMKNMPACVEERQGHPLSLSQLEALPFVEDEAFHPIKPIQAGMSV